MRDRSIGKNKIAILFTTNHADTLGNACRLSLVGYIADKYDATIVTNQSRFVKEQFPSFRVTSIDGRARVGFALYADYLYGRKISRIINSLNPDICFMFMEDSSVANWLDMPVIQYVHQHGYRTDRTKVGLKMVYRLFIGKIQHHRLILGLRKSYAVFVASEQIMAILDKQGVRNQYHLSHALELNIYRYPLIMEAHARLSKLKAEGFFLVAYTGWVTENRGFSIMMEVTRRLVAKGIKLVLVIAGADNAFSKLIEDYKDQNSLHDHIVNYGVVDVSLIPGILHYADTCISLLDDNVPAYRISPPQKVIEYFAAGKAVICNSIETHLSLVSNEHTGLITEYDAESVSQAIDRLYNDFDLLKKLSSNALEESKKYDIDKVYGKLVETMDRIISEREAGKRQ